MTEVNNDTTGSITITVQPQDNGQYICQMSSSKEDTRQNWQCYGYLARIPGILSYFA